MKTRLFTLALALTASLSGFAQDKHSLKIATEKMISLSDNEVYGDLAGTIYPKFFNVVSKEEYLKQFENKMKGDGYNIHMVRIDPSVDYGAIKRTLNGVYCIVNFDRMMTVELQDKVEEKDIKGKEDFFKKLLNTENVYYITENNTVDIKQRVQLVALADNVTYKQWAFVDPKEPAAAEIIHGDIEDDLNGVAVTDPKKIVTPNPEGHAKAPTEAERNVARKKALLEIQEKKIQEKKAKKKS